MMVLWEFWVVVAITLFNNNVYGSHMTWEDAALLLCVFMLMRLVGRKPPTTT
jgi:hypothetical protein